MNISSFHFSLQTTRSIVSFLLPLPLGLTPASLMGTQVVQKSQVQRPRRRNADLCCRWNRRQTNYHEWIVVTQVTGMRWDTQIQSDTLSHWDCPITSSVKEQNMNCHAPRTINEHTHDMWNKVHHSVSVSATAVHENPTWNNERWFFNVLLCHGKFRFTQGLAFKVCHTILQNLPSLSAS